VKQQTENQKVVFLDRDGVINKDSPAYIKDWKEFEFIPDSLEALQRLAAANITTIIISNQSAVNRGLMDLETLLDIHRRLKESVTASGGHIEDIFFCPHRPDEKCICRKPQTGLIRQACRRYNIDVKKTIMVGDSVRDIECARNAGCAAAVLVKSGYGREAADILTRKGISIDCIAEDLAAAIDWILSRHLW
jgi:D-glycero-D-manno-heptose 1,7-bisphosphate phosphatase